MSKKRGKSPAATAVADNKWDQNITNDELNNTNWTYSMAILIPNIPEDQETIDCVNIGVKGGLRRRFTIINREKVMQTIGEFGNAKNKKGKEFPANSEVCEMAMSQMDKGDGITPVIMGKLIKWIMMTERNKDLSNKSPKKSDPKQQKSAAGKKGAADKGDRSKSGAKKGGGKTPEPPSVKKDSKLRKRGEPDPDIPYIDDEPDDGSSRYFVVSGITDCQVIESMAEIGCIVTSIVRVTRDIHIPKNADRNLDDTENSNNNNNYDSIPVTISNEELEEYESKLQSLNATWMGIKETLNKNKVLLDTPVVTMEAKHLMFPIDKEDEELQNKCCMDLFECVAVLMYDILDLKRQWRNYLSKSKMLILPEKVVTTAPQTSMSQGGKPMETIRDDGQTPVALDESMGNKSDSMPSTFCDVDLSYYHYTMKDIPIEESSIYLQMSAMLDQVEVSLGEKESELTKVDDDKPKDMSENVAKLLKKMTDEIYLSAEDKTRVLAGIGIGSNDNKSNDLLDPDINNQSNASIHSLDDISIRSQLLNNGDSLTKELRVLVNSFRHIDLTSFSKLDNDIARKRAARLMRLLSVLDNSNLSRLEIDYAIKIFLLESIQLTSTDENGIIMDPNEEGLIHKFKNQIWDDPFMIMDDVARSVVDEELEFLRIKTKKNTSGRSRGSSLYDALPKSTRSEYSTEGGILKTSRTSSQNSSRVHSPENTSRKRRRSSVRFQEANLILPGDDADETKESATIHLTEDQLTVDDLLDADKTVHLQNLLADILQKIRKRSFTEWCFEELYEPHVLLQLLHEAFYRLPHVDVYPLRYDLNNRKLVVLNNPFRAQAQRINHQSWNQWLHSNVGFRNYLDYVSEKITDWNREEEAIYQAQLLSKEIINIKIDDEKRESETEVPTKKGGKPADKGKKRPVSKSRSRSASGSSGDEDKDKNTFSTILPNSLKAQKMEKEKLERIRDDEEKKKEEKRVASAKKKADKEAEKSGKESKRPNSKSSAKSKGKKKSIDNIPDVTVGVKDAVEGETQPEEYWPFVCYSLGDNLAHFNGDLIHLFPNDGSTIRINKHKQTLSNQLVRMSLITTSNHVFSLHIIDPLMPSDFDETDDSNTANDNGNEILSNILMDDGNWSKLNCATCVFNDGLCIASSNNGFSGLTNETDEELENKGNLLGSCRGTETQRSGGSRAADEIDDSASLGKEQSDIARNSSFETNVSDNNARNNIDQRGLPNLVVSIPNGVEVKVGYEFNDEIEPKASVLLHMVQPPQPPSLSKSTNQIEAVRETSRYVSCNGYVICNLSDNTVKILFADGTSAVTNSCLDKETTEVEKPEPEPEMLNVKETVNPKKKPKQSKANIELSQMPQASPPDDAQKNVNTKLIRNWEITLPTGEVYLVKTNMENLRNQLVQFSTDDTEEKEDVKENVDVEVVKPDEDTAAEEVGDEANESGNYVENIDLKENLLVSSATDPSNGVMMLNRLDKTCLLVSPETGIFLAEHPDGTRFTKYYEVHKRQTKKENNLDSEDFVIEILQIESKNYPMVSVDLTNRKIETTFGSMGILSSSSTGDHFYRHSDCSEIEYRADGEMLITAPSPPPPQMTFLQPYGSCSYLFNPSGGQDKIIFELIDTDGSEMVVDIFGNYKIKSPKKKTSLATTETNADDKDNVGKEKEKKEKECDEPSKKTDSDDFEEGEEEKSEEPIKEIENKSSVKEPERPKQTSAISCASAFDDTCDGNYLRKYEQHAPRVFILNEDGSGSELLRYRDIVEFLVTAEINDEYLKYKEELQDCPQINAFTIFHPITKLKPWQYEYSRKSILPLGLTCRDLKSLSPDTKMVIDGGSNKGQDAESMKNDLSNEKPTNLTEHSRPWKNPLLFRQFYHYPVITEDSRTKLAQHLIEYNRDVLGQRKYYKEVEIADVRTEEEIESSLEVKQRYISRLMTKEVLDNAIKQLIETPECDESENIKKSNEINETIENKENIENKLDLIMERARITNETNERNREILRNKIVPNYFTSVYGKDFISNQAFDLQALNKCMNIFPTSREATADVNNADVDDKEDERLSQRLDQEINPTRSCDGNITEFGDAKYKHHPETKTIFRKIKKNFLYYDSSLILPEVQRSLPQSRDLGLPKCLFSERPTQGPNVHQAIIEDPVRRKILTTSMIGGSRLGQVFQRYTRGLNCLPARLDSGLLCEGRHYTMKFRLINTGPESCRFKVKQPPNNSGIWVEFLPGPIPAGLSRTVHVHIYALSLDPEVPVTTLEHDLMVTTETDILKIPIVARVMTSDKYDESMNANGSKFIANELSNISSGSDMNKVRRQTITLSRP